MTITTATPPPSWLSTWAHFIMAHERILVIIIAGLLLFHYGEKGFGALETYQKNKATADQQRVIADTQLNKQQAQQLAEMKAQAELATAAANAAISAAHQASIQHRTIDKTLPLPDLALRWSVLTQTPPTEFTATPDNKVAVTEKAARNTVDQLETIPDLKATITGTGTKLQVCEGVRAKQDQTIIGLNKTVEDTQVARIADAKVANDEKKRMYVKGFKHGFIAGVVVTTVAFVAGILH